MGVNDRWKVLTMTHPSEQQITEAVLNKERLAVLRELALVNDGPDTYEMVYDRMTTLASKIVGSPVAMMSMVAADFQFFKSHTGLPEPWRSHRQTPLSDAFCKHVVATKQPLVVTDAREVDFLKDNGGIPNLNIIGYLGIPVDIQMSGETRTLGSFCVIDNKPRQWSETEIGIVSELAQLITHEIELKAQARVDASQEARVTEMHRKINHLLDELDLSQPQADILSQLRALRHDYAI